MLRISAPLFSALGIILAATSVLHAETTTFSYTGAEQTYVVPTGVTSLFVTVKGASGAIGGTFIPVSKGGSGAIVTAALPVTPGETLAIYVGGQGGPFSTTDTLGSTGGFNGGGNGGSRGDSGTNGGGGGGASDIRQGGNTLAQRVVIAGGGGGGGGGQTHVPAAPVAGGGGAAGFLGQDGGNSYGGIANGGGTGASQSAGGTPGGNYPAAHGSDEVFATAGLLGAGGQGGLVGTGSDGSESSNGGGGGGGGLFGGSGGGGTLTGGFREVTGAGGGGGGSSYVISTATNATFAVRADTDRAGSVTISTNVFVTTEAQLRQAIQNANDGDTITLTADITLTSDLPPILTNITLEAGNHVLDGAGLYRILFAQGGTLTLDAIQLAHGDVVIGSGTTGGIAGSFTLSSGTNLRFDRSDDVVLDATLFGGGTITQEGTGVLTIHGSNTFTGNLVVKSGGTVKITQANPAYPQITNDGVVIFDSSSTSNYLGVISGSGVVVQSGGGSWTNLTLGNSNSYAGGTTFKGGSISLTSLDHLGTGPLVFDGGALQWSGSSTDISVRPVTMKSDGRIDIPQATTVTFANAIGNGGPGGITKAGDGTLVLLASTSYTGETDLEGGTLRLGTGVHIGPVSLLTANNGGNFVCDENNVIGSLTFTSDDIGLRLKLGPNTQVPAISGAFTNAVLTTAQIRIDLIPDGVLTMGQAYTLLTYGSTNLQASDFAPVSGGTFVVEPHALKFKLDGGGGPAPARHGVAVKTARGRNRVTYTVTNTGETNAVFRIAADITIQSSLQEARLLKRSVTITTLLDGGKAPKSLTGRGASVPLPPGGKTRIDIKVATRGKTAGVPAVRTTLQARDLTTPGISDRAQAVIKP